MSIFEQCNSCSTRTRSSVCPATPPSGIFVLYRHKTMKRAAMLFHSGWHLCLSTGAKDVSNGFQGPLRQQDDQVMPGAGTGDIEQTGPIE